MRKDEQNARQDTEVRGELRKDLTHFKFQGFEILYYCYLLTLAQKENK